MNNVRKTVIFLILFACITVYSFGDIFYSFSLGINRLNEQYPDEDYGRELNGISLVMSLNYYPEKSPLGWFIRTSLGGLTTSYEWMGNSIESLSFDSSTDLSLSLGPSFVFTGPIIYIPISIGPLVTSYREEAYGYYEDVEGFYEAVNIGALLDIGVIINPARRFIITNSIIVSYDFARWERGNMTTSYREIRSGNFYYTNYSAFNVGFYFGLGIRFGGLRNNNQ